MDDGAWPKRTFADLIESGVLLVSDGYRAKNDELGGDGLIFLRAGHLTDSHIDLTGVDQFRSELTPRIQSKAAQPGDVMVTTKGNSTGRVGFVTPELPPFVYSPHLSFWRSLDNSVLVPGFLRAWSRGPEFQHQLRALSHGTDMAPYLSLIDQQRLRVTLPPPRIQRAIAHILGTLDDKIELNRRMNRTLEEMAAVLFKSWFVDFDPVRAKAEGRRPEGMDAETAALFPSAFAETVNIPMPDGWELWSLSDLAEINGSNLGNRDQMDTIDYVDISAAAHGEVTTTQRHKRGDEPSRARRRLRHGDTALSMVRPDRGSYFLALDPAPTLIASTGFAVITPKVAPWSFIFAAMTRRETLDYLGQLADGGAYPAVRPETVANYTIVWEPSGGVATAFQRIAGPLLHLAELKRREVRALSKIREILLIPLLSGEIVVCDKDN